MSRSAGEALGTTGQGNAAAGPQRGLLDTSIFIAREIPRRLDVALLPEESAVSAVTVGELQAGVLAAESTPVRARRLATLEAIGDVEVLAVDEAVAGCWAMLRVHVAEAGRRVNVNDLWIAATALAHKIPVVTQDGDFGVIEGAGGLQVVYA